MNSEIWKEDLKKLIDDAERDGKWLKCNYQGILFSPQELRKENAQGKFVWGVCNWRLVNPREYLIDIPKCVSEMEAKNRDLLRRIEGRSNDEAK